MDYVRTIKDIYNITYYTHRTISITMKLAPIIYFSYSFGLYKLGATVTSYLIGSSVIYALN